MHPRIYNLTLAVVVRACAEEIFAHDAALNYNATSSERTISSRRSLTAAVKSYEGEKGPFEGKFFPLGEALGLTDLTRFLSAKGD